MVDRVEMTKIRDWEDLVGLENESYWVEVRLDQESGWIRSKSGETDFYLSTHTFYESMYKHSNALLQDCGFNVELVSWG